MDLKIKIEGAKELDRVLRELGPKAAGKAADDALFAGAKPVVDEAKRRAPEPGAEHPYSTGQLRDAIVAQLARKHGPDARRMLIGVAGPRARIAHLLEYGTVHASARPFLRAAIDTQGKDALDRIGRMLGTAIEREAKKLARPSRARPIR